MARFLRELHNLLQWVLDLVEQQNNARGVRVVVEHGNSEVGQIIRSRPNCHLGAAAVAHEVKCGVRVRGGRNFGSAQLLGAANDPVVDQIVEDVLQLNAVNPGNFLDDSEVFG